MCARTIFIYHFHLKHISLNKSKQNGDNNLKKIVITLLVGVKVVQWLYLAYSLYIDSTDFFFK